jgi:hypothetical protein
MAENHHGDITAAEDAVASHRHSAPTNVFLQAELLAA